MAYHLTSVDRSHYSSNFKNYQTCFFSSFFNNYYYCSRLIRKKLSHNPRLKFLLLLLLIVLGVYTALQIDWPFYLGEKLNVKTGLALYPMEVEDFPRTVALYRAGVMNASLPKPINLRYAKVNFSVSPTVNSNVDILIIIKSARNHSRKREIIRQTWGDPKHLEENVLALHNLSTQLFFICGKSHPGLETEVESGLIEESSLQKDMIVAEFIDTYHNNTYKSLLAFKWALTKLEGHFKYLLLLDDDIYVDMANVGSFLMGLKQTRVIKTESPYSGFPYFQMTSRVDEKAIDFNEISRGLFIGSVYHESHPSRNPKSKWFTSYDDYPYNMFPPYVPGAGILLDYKAVSDMYYASHFMKHLWIDDVYLGIIAAKLGIIPLHNENFQAGLKLNENFLLCQISQVIILHGLDCPDRILDFWEKRYVTDLVECPTLD